MTNLEGKIALVTGASRGVGRGIARGLGEARATVYVTGRTGHTGPGPAREGTVEAIAAEVDAAGGRGIPLVCDHGDDAALARLFERIAADAGQIDLLVNNVHSGIGALSDVAHQRFWEYDPGVWDQMTHVGLRSHYRASVHAARMMVPRGRGTIVNISSYGSVVYLFNLAYGVGKTALDRMTADMAFELKGTGVTALSLWPGFVQTELTEGVVRDARAGYQRIYEAYRETPLLTGRAAAALAADPRAARFAGRWMLSAEVARRYGLREEDGSRPWSPRSVKSIVRAALPRPLAGIAALLPPVRIPEPLVRAILRRFSAIIKEQGGYRRREGA